MTRNRYAFTAYLFLVMAESFGYWQMIDPRYSIEEGMEILMDMFQYGMVHANPSDQEPIMEKGPSGEVEDSKGMKTRLEDISFDRKYYLRGRLGDAEVDVDLSMLASLRFFEKGAGDRAALTMRDGQEFVIDVDAEMSLVGTAPFGSLRLPLKCITSVSF